MSNVSNHLPTSLPSRESVRETAVLAVDETGTFLASSVVFYLVLAALDSILTVLDSFPTVVPRTQPFLHLVLGPLSHTEIAFVIPFVVTPLIYVSRDSRTRFQTFLVWIEGAFITMVVGVITWLFENYIEFHYEEYLGFYTEQYESFPSFVLANFTETLVSKFAIGLLFGFAALIFVGVHFSLKKRLGF